jgi:hypothetical protein
MATVLFVSETYIKNNTTLSDNVDVKLIQSNIGPAQDFFLQDILGTNLFNDLKTKYSAQTLSVIEEQLVQIIKQAVVYRATELSLPFMNIQLRNKGLVNLNSENAVQSDLAGMKYLRNELKDRAEFYEERIKKFLENNESSFPLYADDTNDDISPNKRNTYDCDIYLGYPDKRCGNINLDNCNCD